MQLKMCTDQAINVVLYIASTQCGMATSVEISEKVKISPNYIHQMIARLRRAGIVATTQGVSGGCHLVRPPRDITIFDIITAMEGTIAISRCLEEDHECGMGIEDSCPLRQVYMLFQSSMTSFFQRVTIDDLMTASITGGIKLPQLQWDDSILDTQDANATPEGKLEKLNYTFEMMPRELREHSTRTSLMAPWFCEQIMNNVRDAAILKEMNAISSRMTICARFHDLGMQKVLVRHNVSMTGGTLENAEYRYHPLLGMEFIRRISDSSPISCDSEAQWWRLMMECTLCHHENWDGSGYPAGLVGDKIPLIARVMAIINDFDHHRQNGLTKEEALDIIRPLGGTRYDPALTAAL